jgi:hypothetical protein
MWSLRCRSTEDRIPEQDELDDLRRVSVNFEFDGERMKLQKKAVPRGMVLPSRTQSSLSLELRKSQMKVSRKNIEILYSPELL